MIIVVNHGLGNVGSIINMLDFIGFEAKASVDPDALSRADKIILPGVGAFDAGMKAIREKGIVEVLKRRALVDKIPFLGICLGMQMLTQGSEEGKLPGFGWISAKTVSFKKKSFPLRVPHIGWNKVMVNKSHPFSCTVTKESKFYFVHSYYVQVDNEKNSLMKTDYGLTFDSAIVDDNIFGTQFHPEKSHRHGMKILKHFASI